jgi:hypothetical protein
MLRCAQHAGSCQNGAGMEGGSLLSLLPLSGPEARFRPLARRQVCAPKAAAQDSGVGELFWSDAMDAKRLKHRLGLRFHNSLRGRAGGTMLAEEIVQRDFSLGSRGYGRFLYAERHTALYRLSVPSSTGLSCTSCTKFHIEVA